MFKNALSVAGAVISLFMVTAQASAVTLFATGNDIVAANMTYRAAVLHFSGPFSDTFDFTYNSPYLTSLLVANGGADGTLLTIPDGVTYTFIKEAGAFDTVISTGGIAPGASFFDFGLIATGVYHLVFTGTATPPAGVYGFELNVMGPPSETPLPATLAMFASVIFSGFGFAKLRRRRRP